jgi:hypothetical protein
VQSHTLFLCMHRIQKNGWELLPHPPYSGPVPFRQPSVLGFQRIRCKASTTRPMRQSRNTVGRPL